MIITSKPMILENSPVRQSLPRRRQNFIVNFPSLKNGRSIECEAILESSYCIWLEYYPQVLRYYAQPHTFTWIDDNQLYRYTPDFLVITNDGGSYFTEVKYDFTKQCLNRIIKLESFNNLCIQEGWSFQQHDKLSITGSPEFMTLKAVYSRCRNSSDQQQAHFCYYIRQRSWPATLGELIQDNAAPHASTIFYNILLGRLVVDLTQKLTPSLLIDWRPEHA
ncbi:hypothetical protein GRW89_06255 [Pseudomonas moraviensis]|uniref:TnsA endonuclease N-terminal domain-containing protein n=1 Tax=Pseudomonas TaxID=286 RepID=UPI00135D6818|nr:MULTISPECIES: TnsA endonuclease N-terminal domain-containing protein [Pseudomonas]MXI46106.1 hypothetical protein [Pseudomonas moraviensis]WLG64145.1 TnsA endonuclease N-terminal domain-containing protein [Pseudomonas sp. FP1762]